MLINYNCFHCGVKQYNENPPLKSENFMQEFFTCKCSHCKEDNLVMVYKPLQMQIQFPPFKLN